MKLGVLLDLSMFDGLVQKCINVKFYTENLCMSIFFTTFARFFVRIYARTIMEMACK